MACDITAGRTRECKDSLGGLSKLYLFNNIADPFTVAASVCTAINAGVTVVYEYEIEGDGNNVSESLVSDRNTGTSVNTQTLTISLKQMSATSSAQLNLLAYGYPIAVVKDRNGIYHALGIDDGIDFTVVAASGGAKTEMNGYTLTGIATTGALSPKLDTDTIADLLALLP